MGLSELRERLVLGFCQNWPMSMNGLSSRNKQIRPIVGSCNRKDRNDGNERSEGDVTCDGTRSTSSPEISEA